MDVRIRLISSSDRDAWLTLRRALWPDTSEVSHDEEMAQSLRNLEELPVFVAEAEDGRLVGMIELSIHDRAPGCNTDRIGYIEGWYVAEPLRRQGVGGKLVKEAEDWARAAGCTEMASDTTLSYPVSPVAHKALGYEEVETVTCFKKSLT
jgi:aminoglycoside 6'-N-acetyltransferase I